jgi:hemin uptake protein HemP
MYRMMTKFNHSPIETHSLSLTVPAAPGAALAETETTMHANDEVALRLSSQAILCGRREIEIEHRGMVYRLRCTSLGKLILTK